MGLGIKPCGMENARECLMPSARFSTSCGRIGNISRETDCYQKGIQMTNTLKFVCEMGKAHANGEIVHRFLVKKGSTVQKVSDSLPSRYLKIRNKLEKDKVIVDDKFEKDYEFDSPTQATCVILGTSCANFSNWKLEQVCTLHDIWDNPKRTRGKSVKKESQNNS